MDLVQKKIDSKIGALFLTASDKGLCGIFWKKQDLPRNSGKPNPKAQKILTLAEKQVEEYLDGKRKDFDLPLDMQGTEFQKRVWKRLSKIPYGCTKSYKEIAVEIKDPNASRAVGTANGRNPVCIIVPCHRVISSDGSIGGYAGGLEIKSKLLYLESNGKLPNPKV